MAGGWWLVALSMVRDGCGADTDTMSDPSCYIDRAANSTPLSAARVVCHGPGAYVTAA
jgi:hypothetical protein